MQSNRRNDGLSICIPNWNHRTFLPRSLGSAVRAARLLALHGLGCQITVADDLSRDGSQRLLFNLALQSCDADIDVVLSDENRGLGANRNILLRAARYQAVCFLDADNELAPANLPIFLKAFHDTGAALIYGNLIQQDSNRSVGLLSNDFIHKDIYRENYVDAFCIVNSDKIESVGSYYGKHAPAHEDWELLLHLISESEEVVFVPLVMGYYHVLDFSMIKTTESNHSKVHRIFAQRGRILPLTFKHRRIYHPDLGWL